MLWGLFVGVFWLRVLARGDLGSKGLGCCLDLVSQIRVLLHETRKFALGDSQEVVEDEHLSIGIWASADPDRWDLKAPSDLLGQSARHRFEHQRECASRLE